MSEGITLGFDTVPAIHFNKNCTQK